MKSILKEFFYGNISPTGLFFGRNSEYGRAMKTLSDNEEKLLEVLNESEKTIFTDFYNAQSETNNLSDIRNFTNGFKLGALFMLEILTNNDELY